MLDVSGSMYGNLALIRAAAGELFARLGPNDLGRVVLLGHEITISARFTRSVPELLAILPRSIEPTAPTPLWRAMAEALRVLEEPSEERRVILVLSDGKDDTGSPRSGPIGYTADFVIDRARRNDVMIYAIGLYSRLSNRYVTPGSFTSALNDDTPDPNLERVAAESGGGYIEIRRGEDLAAAFTRVADELHSQYLLGFTPPERDGKKHDIGVRVLKRGMQPRARKSYVAPER